MLVANQRMNMQNHPCASLFMSALHACNSLLMLLTILQTSQLCIVHTTYVF